MKTIDIRQTIIRTLLIFAVTILLGSLGYTIVFSIAGGRLGEILETFWILMIISAVLASPALPITYFGLRYIYSIADSPQERYLYLFFLGLISSIIVLFIVALLEENFATIGAGYTIAAIIATMTVPYFKGDLKKMG